MVHLHRKLIFSVYIGFYLATIILPKICVCSQFSIPSSDQFSKAPGAFPVATNGEPFPWHELRLPNTVIPLHYDLFVHPNLTSMDFVASEKIEVLVRDATQFIILHSKNLEIMNVTLHSEEDLKYRKPGKKLNVLSYPAHQQIALLVPEKLIADLKYYVAIDFQAKLADGFEGFYKSTYRNLGGETRTIAVTDFEPTEARMAFPCFDEPSFKANFSIKIRRESRHIALSNMPKVKTIELEGSLLEDHFETTVKMSTYLVAYIVCDFKSVSGTTSSGVKVSIYASPDKWSQTHYALEASLKLLDFYENYFDINYPLPKLDLIAIPDFGPGAMENWGLITYRETSLLFDPKTSSISDKLWVTTVIAHELAHQWFGNLVTMEWWNDIWLNEGFATFMELISLDATYPELHFDYCFLEVCFEAIKRDSLNSSRPISNQAKTPTQIQEMFDTVSYNKGACILNMLKDFLSEEKFHKGIIHYLKKFSYGNTKNDDLWSSLSNSCSEGDFTSGGFCYSDSKRTTSTLTSQGENAEVKEMTATWTLQKGIPLVVVEQEGRSLRLRQERFLSGVFKEDPEWRALQEGYLWHIPLTYSTRSSNTIHRHILKSKTDTLDLPEKSSWVKFNVNSNGYYIVHYEGHGWDQLIAQLNQNHTLLRPKDRVGLIHDAFQLVSAGRLTLDKALDLTRYLQHETSIPALLKGLGYLELFYHMMDRRNISDVTENLKHYLLQYFKPVIDTQSWSDEGSIWDRMLRSTLLKLACDLNHAPCIQKATELFSQWMESSGKLNIPTDVLKIVYSVGAQTTAGWNYLLEQYELSVSGAEKNKILYALSTSKHQEKLMKLIELGMEGKIIKTQDLAALLHAIARNPKGQQLAWNFVRENWTHLLKKFDLGSYAVRMIISGTTSHFSFKDELQEVKLFFESLKAQGSHLDIFQTVLETISKNIKWLEKNLPTLRTWLLVRT
ncbi:PREDICTED: endoplasmic reticulum aminopeptidase 2 [Miniopterus natalensis]|uniref:endoplasmic reticulum aminopeptidase 2 n=1 Tax=Miniopterus natalensis TaxID=291302 RepID=UPI0007A6C754|nr:PREDICTED: endoplasmic reticulum aminopeptidase 2 [Miniopterus natalensis]XP_016071676.1 PREDICTED: endoplasmic reticulum aminopeptidase 2 [Miniopterus natalensis]